MNQGAKVSMWFLFQSRYDI